MRVAKRHKRSTSWMDCIVQNVCKLSVLDLRFRLLEFPPTEFKYHICKSYLKLATFVKLDRLGRKQTFSDCLAFMLCKRPQVAIFFWPSVHFPVTIPEIHFFSCIFTQVGLQLQFMILFARMCQHGFHTLASSCLTKKPGLS